MMSLNEYGLASHADRAARTYYHNKPLRVCPSCKSGRLEFVRVRGKKLPWWYVSCMTCGKNGDIRLFLLRAVKAWNEMRE